MLRPAAALGLGAAVFVFGLLAHNHFPNDHFVHLSSAAQMLAGEWPTRDFADPGMPLMYAVSAAAQWLGSRTLFAEAALVYGALAGGAALLTVAVARLTSSTVLGLWAGACTALIGPRTYGYPKILLYAAAVHIFVWGARSRSERVPIALAALTAVAFLFRHDHGLFIGTAGICFLLVAEVADGRDRMRTVVRYAALTALLTVPYVAFVHFHVGVAAYITSAVEFSQREALRTGLDSWTPSLHSADVRRASAAALFYVFWALPALAAGVALASKDRRPAAAPAVGAVCVLAIAANAGFLRDRLEDRIADAVVPAVTLAAFLAASALGRREPHASHARAFAAAAALSVFAAGTAAVGQFAAQFARTEVHRGPAAAAARLGQVTSELIARRAAPQMPSAVALALMPFFDYVEACTRPTDTLFVPGFAPEVAYFARRRFAGGHVTLLGEYYSSEAEQLRTVHRLERQSVPLVVLPPESEAALARHHPRVAAWLRQYDRLAEYRDHQDRITEVRVRAALPALRTHPSSGFPCFR